MSLRCPFNTVLISSTCYYPCQGGYEPRSEDPTVCVSTALPPTGFTKIGTSNSQILKGVCAPPVSGTCPDITCSVNANQCLRICPVNYTDGGLMCIKYNINRLTAQPECPNLYYLPYGGNTCVLTPWGITLYVLFIGSICTLIYQFLYTSFGFGNSAALNSINAHLRKAHGVTSFDPKLLLLTILFIFLLGALFLTQG